MHAQSTSQDARGVERKRDRTSLNRFCTLRPGRAPRGGGALPWPAPPHERLPIDAALEDAARAHRLRRRSGRCRRPVSGKLDAVEPLVDLVATSAAGTGGHHDQVRYRASDRAVWISTADLHQMIGQENNQPMYELTQPYKKVYALEDGKHAIESSINETCEFIHTIGRSFFINSAMSICRNRRGRARKPLQPAFLCGSQFEKLAECKSWICTCT